MKCKICGAESGKYPLCKACNELKIEGKVIKCATCGMWHFADSPCAADDSSEKYAYSVKDSLITKTELKFYEAITSVLPENHRVFPQINLAAVIDKKEPSKYQSELFRNVDFLITDADYKPKVVIEINDQTHINRERYVRDEKVQKICEEAGLPLIKLWVSFGVNPEYIQKKIQEAISNPPERIHHFSKVQQVSEEIPQTDIPEEPQTETKKGCYIATCVYGSYDCPQVWVLRRFRDNVLQNSFFGRLFIKLYYRISPSVVSSIHSCKPFISLCRKWLDLLVNKLRAKGFEDTPYND